MKRLILLLAASALTASPALGQHQGHHMPAPPAAKKAPAKKAPAARKAPARKPAVKKAAPKPAAKKAAPKAAAKKAPARKAATKKAPPRPLVARKPAVSAPADPHASHASPAAQPPADPHAGHAAPTAPPAADPHAGHAMPVTATADPHAGHDVSPAVDPPVAPPPAEALSGPDNAADTVWGGGPMAVARREMNREHGGMRAYRLLIDRLEVRSQKGPDGYSVDAEAWYGGDIDKLWIKAESEGEFGERFEGAELQALWSHAIDPWFDLQAGVRYDLRRGSDRAHLVIGTQGLAPYWIEVDAAAFLSDKGDVTARIEAEHDVRITQKLIAQPRVELDFALQDVPEQGFGAGLAEASAGLRVRYQISPLFAPYLGVEYERAIGDSRRFRRLADEDVGGIRLVAGVRAWF